MARRYNETELEGIERRASAPLPLTGLIRLNTSRNRKGNKVWRPLQPSDLPSSESLGEFDKDSSSSPIGFSHTAFGAPPPSTQLPQDNPSPFHSPNPEPDITAQQESAPMDNTSEEQSVFPNGGSDEFGPADSDNRPHVVENHMRLFGELPDIIRLHEKTGDFDGQVVFIGHPNRDVSAHQWLSASFQWVNIGLWSHTRQRIEGSLASDRLAGTGLSYNSIEYFKFVSEHRESLIKEFGRPESETTETLPSLAGPKTNDVSDQSVSETSTASTTRTITREKLEDPFVTPAEPSPARLPAPFNFRGAEAGNVGSMNFNYEFPLKSAAKNTEHQQVYIQRERERLQMLRRNGESSRERGTHTDLREVEFGEEAATAPTPPAARLNASRLQNVLTPEDIQNRLQVQSLLIGTGEPAHRPSLPVQQRVAVPDFSSVNSNIKELFPPGRTVANPNRGVSTLNAAAAPYRMPNTAKSSAASGSSVTALDVSVPADDTTLRFSDPDIVCQEQTQPIVNGSNQHAPIKQNFNGPFFCKSMPTTDDPTTSLTVHSSNEAKLVEWYRDGQSFSRQKDYAKSLMAAALASNKAHTFGAIGEVSSTMQDSSKYENTPFFARVYENLFRYAEESREGGNSSYFTRAWKPAPLHLRDLAPNGNNSFFGGTTSMSPQLNRAPTRPYPSFQGNSSPWGAAGRSSSSPFSAQYMPIGGPSSGRF